MKHYAPPSPLSRTPPLKLPPFHPVEVRPRRDGWTPQRQAEFIGHLAQTRSVAAAAKAVSMARESAYRLRERPGARGFAAVWDMALARRGTAAEWVRYLEARERALAALLPSRNVTLGELDWRVRSGKWQVILRAGRFAGVRQVADNDALLVLVRRMDAIEARFRSEEA